MLTGFPVHQEVLNPYTANGGAWAFARRGSGGDDDKLDALTRERFEKRFPGGADEAETEFFALVYSHVRRADSLPTNRGRAADSPRRRVAATPRSQRGWSMETAAPWPRCGYSPGKGLTPRPRRG